MRARTPLELDETRPLIAVVVPTFERSDLVVRAVQSILAQRFTRFEVVVVDDGSTEDIGAALAAVCDDVRVRVVRQPRGGVSRARNTGVAATNAPFLTFLDSDDEADPGWLLAMAKAAGDDLDVFFVGCTYLHEDGTTTEVEPRDLGPGYGGVVGRYLAGTFLVKRTIFDEVGGYRPGLRLGENGDLGMRIGAWSRSNELRSGWTSRSLNTVHVPTCPYDPALNYEAVRAVLADLPDLLDEDRALLATHFAIAGVAAARLGHRHEARRLLARAVRYDPLEWRHGARWLRTLSRGGPAPPASLDRGVDGS